jgi:hypothetical protein
MSISQELSSGKQARQATVPARPPSDSAAVPMTGAEANPRRRTLGGRFASRRTLSRWCAAVLALLTAAMIGLGAAPASAATLAVSNTFDCAYDYGRTATVGLPQMYSITGASEAVYWQPDLYRWNGSSWQLYRYAPWFHAVANSRGVISQWYAVTNYPITQWKWGPLTDPGYYMVANYYQWQNGSQTSGWSNYNGGGLYCPLS